MTIIDSIPTFLTIFGIVRDQYFFLGEEIASAVPTTALALIYSLMVIELAEPGQEGLCYGLIGTVQHASLPIATALSNQIFGLFKPSLSLLENYVTDTPAFRSTVAWSYVLTYAASLLGMCALPLVPRQKADVQRRKKEPRFRTLHAFFLDVCLSLSSLVSGKLKFRETSPSYRILGSQEWSASSIMAILVLGIPALCLPYGVVVLLLSSQPQTACLRWVGGQGCDHLN